MSLGREQERHTFGQGLLVLSPEYITYSIIRTAYNIVQFCVPFYYQLVSNVFSQIQPRFKPSKSPGHTMHMSTVVPLTPNAPSFLHSSRLTVSLLPRSMLFPSLPALWGLPCLNPPYGLVQHWPHGYSTMSCFLTCFDFLNVIVEGNSCSTVL